MTRHAHRLRAEQAIEFAIKIAGDAGATLVAWTAADIHAVVGFELQLEANRAFNRKLLSTIRVEGRMLMHGMSEQDAERLLSAIDKIEEIQRSVSIPVRAKVRIGHFVEAQLLQAMKVDYIALSCGWLGPERRPPA